MQINDYGKLCTMMYEQLHPTADPQELAFYLSYAKPGEQMLELLCGSGRFLIPFWKKGLSIDGVDLSAQMLEQLEQKLPEAKPALHLHCCSADAYQTEKRYDYIFITCNSFSLFTDEELAKRVLKNAKRLLSEQGVFVFAVDTVSSAEQGDGALTQTTDQPLEDGKLLRMRMGARYEPATQVQYYPSIYELWQGEELLHRWIFRPSSTAWESWTHCWQRQAFAAGRSMTGLTSIPHKGMKRVPCCTSADKGV